MAEFPFGHHHHHHRHHGGEDEPPPEVSYVHHTSHVSSGEPYPPPGVGYVHHHESYSGVYPPPPAAGYPEPYDGAYPPPPAVHHHEPYGEPYPPPPVVHHPESYGQPYPPPPTVHHFSHVEASYQESHHRPAGIDNRPTVRVFCRAETNHSLSIRNGEVILARTDPSDPYQHWIKDEKFSTKVKDEEGLPCFSLVNKVTGEAIKHSIGATHPVRLIPYNPDYLDESILWTESKETGDGYKAIRMVNNIRLNMDALHGDPDHGGVHDGTTIVLWEWAKGHNQQWKIVPY
ncbi:ricin B-like lectin R40G3 [Ipomoea triloba]|uniref:ricin B-like lectin R40G3 n=1 Tax=Ipomoea triloba TaxID=35885 RepID=UPI00125D014A|nr:ricin B-like lectin R40G3 [Ipomoea triloba]